MPSKPVRLEDLDRGLLQFCLMHSDGNVVDNPLPQRDPRDYEWLRKVFSNLESDFDRLRKAMEVVNERESKGGNNNEGKVNAALEEILFFLEDIDVASDFYKVRGVELTIELLHESTASFREYALAIVSCVVQNNPIPQSIWLQNGMFELVLAILHNERERKVREKALGCMSSLIENKLDYQLKFIEHDGIRILGTFLASTNSQQVMKSAFFLNKLLVNFPQHVAQSIVQLHLVEVLSALLSVDHADVRSKVQLLLVNLLRRSASAHQLAKQLKLDVAAATALEHSREHDDADSDTLQQIIELLKREPQIEQCPVNANAQPAPLMLQ